MQDYHPRLPDLAGRQQDARTAAARCSITSRASTICCAIGTTSITSASPDCFTASTAPTTFKHQSMSDRGELIKMIGVKAELWCICSPPQTVRCSRASRTRSVRRNLLEIEAANMLEQGGNVNTLRKLAQDART